MSVRAARKLDRVDRVLGSLWQRAMALVLGIPFLGALGMTLLVARHGDVVSTLVCAGATLSFGGLSFWLWNRKGRDRLSDLLDDAPNSRGTSN